MNVYMRSLDSYYALLHFWSSIYETTADITVQRRSKSVAVPLDCNSFHYPLPISVDNGFINYIKRLNRKIKVKKNLVD
jgi:hypothetical protein